LVKKVNLAAAFRTTMISNFFVLSPRGDTIIAKQYRNDRGDAGAHQRSHTEAFFRKVKFWDELDLIPGGGADGAAGSTEEGTTRKGDAPPVFMMPDGLSYLHVKRNGLIFGCATARNASPVTIIEVSILKIR
jgi:AP-4 complex subunit mu-1